jgi:hypothetical protein
MSEQNKLNNEERRKSIAGMTREKKRTRPKNEFFFKQLSSSNVNSNQLRNKTSGRNKIY